jgi:hypothetical protein
MRYFKPFVNLIHYTRTDNYVLNALINIPSGFSVIDQKQQKSGNNWVVTLLVKKLDFMKGLEASDELSEFSFNLESSDIKDMDKIKLRVSPFDSDTFRDGEGGETDIDPNDSEEDDSPP